MRNKKTRPQRERAFSYRAGEQFLTRDSNYHKQIAYQILARSAVERTILLHSLKP